MPRPSHRSVLIGLLAAAGLAAAAPSPASAGLLVETATDCAEQSLDTVFSPWVDPANYTLAPGGAAESTAGWATLSGASIVAGNEPWKVVSGDHARSLRLPAGSSATTEPICVGLGHPTMRYFARSSGTGLLSLLKTEVLFEGPLGDVIALPIGVVLPSSSWSPTLPMTVIANLLPLLPGDLTPVAFRFTPVGSGTWWIDDVHVDPWRTR